MRKSFLIAVVMLGFCACRNCLAIDPNTGSSFGAGSGLSLTNYAADLNMHWARMPANITPSDIGNMENVYRMLDNTVRMYQENGIVPLGIISPQAGAGGAWVSAAQFAQAVSNIIERYDGDGVQDMPGLRYSVLTWELINEYSSLGGGAYSGLSRDVFIGMMTNGAHALKTACSDARLALDPFDTNDVAALLQNWPATNINIISYHTYSPLDAPHDAGSISYLPNLGAILSKLGLSNIPVWATEYAFYDHTGATPPGVAATQEDNARWFVQTTVWGLGSRLLEKIIYTEVEAPRDSEERLDWMALVDTNAVKRQIYYSFKKLASLIDNFSSADPIVVGTNIYAYRFNCGTSSVAIVWCREGTANQENVTVSGCDGSRAALWSAVPDACGNFSVSTLEVAGASVVIPSLGSTPVIITPVSAPPVPACNAIGCLAADYDGDAKADPAVFNTNGNWNIKLSSANYTMISLAGFLGESGAQPIAADFDGDALADPAVYYDSLGLWDIKLSRLNYAVPTVITSFGGAGWQAVAGDFDGDALADPAVYNTNGTWKVKVSSANYTLVTSVDLLGRADWMPVAADFDGDGKVDPAIYNAASGSWIVILSVENYSLAIVNPWFLGEAGYTGMAADFDGDEYADPSVADVASGHWKIKLSSGNYNLVDLANFLGQ